MAQGSNNGSTVPGTRDTSDRLRNPEERVGDDGKGDDDNKDEIGIAHLADIDIQFGEECPMLASQEQACGDALKHNCVLLWHDLLHYWEMKQCAKEGDMGCLFEMNKVGRHTSYCYCC